MHKHRLFSLFAIAWLMMAGPALAALPEPPGEIASPDKAYVAYGAAAVLVAGVVAIAFKPSKRSHLD